MSPFAQDLERRIEAAYRASGNTLGWRLLYSPVSVLDGAEVAFVGQTPGGDREPPDHPRFATASGSAFVTERWNGTKPGEAALQQQARALFRHLNVAPETVLAGNLVPFRTPGWDALRDQRGALAFGREIWDEILTRVQPRLVIVMGTKARDVLRSVLGATPEISAPLGWGSIHAIRGAMSFGALVGLPILSRCRVIGRPESAPALRAVFGDDWRD